MAYIGAMQRTAQDIGRSGGKARARNMTKAQRIESARSAAKARWAKHRRQKLLRRKAAEKKEVPPESEEETTASWRY